MKYKFKQIAAVTMGLMTLGLTAGIGAGANYPAPFVEDGIGDFAVVHGSGAASTDEAGATQIANDLLALASTGVSGVGSDSIQLKRSSDEFNLWNDATDFYTNLDNDELGTVLADGSYLNDNNDDFDYTQKFTLSSNLNLTHFRDRDYNDYDPALGIHLSKDDNILNYTLDFTPNNAEGTDSGFSDIDSTFIDIMGKEYFISKAESDGGSEARVKLTLLDSANKASLNAGDSTTVTVAGTTYDVSAAIYSSSEAVLTVNGEDTNILNAGDTYKLSDGETHVAVTEIRYSSKEGGAEALDFSIGSGEIVLEDATKVDLNGDEISTLDEYEDFHITAYTRNSTYDLDTITLEWNADDDVFITPDSEITMPVFDSVKVSMQDFVTEAEEKTTIGTGDPFSVTTEIKDGPVTLDLFYLKNDTNFGENLGASRTQHLITSASGGSSSTVNLNLANETYFVASWFSGRDAETYAFELSNIKNDANNDNETTLSNLVSGGSDVVLKGADDNQDVGRLKMTLTASNESAETATIKVEPVSSGDVYTDRVFTAGGMKFFLPAITTTASAKDHEIFLNDSGFSNTTWIMNFTEEDRDGNIQSGNSFGLGISIDTDDGIEANSIDAGLSVLQIGRTSDDYEGYVGSDLGTKLDWTKDTSGLDAMEVTYHDTEAYGEIFVSSTDATDDGSLELGDVLVTDSEVSSVQNKNLIVVGGSCINSVAASLVGGAHCGSDWTDATGVGSGEFLIESFENPNNSDKIALLVAGYEAADTTNAATYLRNQGDGTDIGVNSKYTGSESTSVEAVVN